MVGACMSSRSLFFSTRFSVSMTSSSPSARKSPRISESASSSSTREVSGGTCEAEGAAVDLTSELRHALVTTRGIGAERAPVARSRGASLPAATPGWPPRGSPPGRGPAAEPPLPHRPSARPPCARVADSGGATQARDRRAAGSPRQPPSERRPASRSSVEELLGPANLLLIGRKKENSEAIEGWEDGRDCKKR